MHFSGYSLLLAVCILFPILYYWIKSTDESNEEELIEPIDNTMVLDDLAPVDEAEHSKAYLDALRWGVGNPKVLNIAITGPYGSGKSSILKTFKKTYESEFNYLNISLASFTDQSNDAPENHLSVSTKEGVIEDSKQTKTAEQRKNEAQQLIELSVLQQIFYKVDQAEIPNSRFKRIGRISNSDLTFFVIGTLGSLFGTLGMVFPNQQFSFIIDFSTRYPDTWKCFLLAMTLPGIIWLIIYLTHFFRESGLKKLNISSGEIEIDPKSEASILNKYLDELIYFFSATKFNVVMIEDMDRFNDPEIFTKLRELNTLLNHSKQVGRRIVFVYAIKDDMFPDDRTRTKFFDLIIPVIPVINWSNSAEKLKKKLKDAQFDIEPRFITGITLYIDDMRSLKNIFNELVLYSKALQIPKERHTKLLAMVVYKNMYPEDFASLHEGKGLVFGLFEKMDSVIASAVLDLNNKILDKEQVLEISKKGGPQSLRELRSAYVIEIANKQADFVSFYFDNNAITLAEMREDEYFKKLVENKKVTYLNNNNRVLPAKYDFKEIEEIVLPAVSYSKRESLIKASSEKNLGRHMLDLMNLQDEKSKAEALTLAELISMKEEAFPEIDESNKELRLLRFLLSRGYIDRSYPYLISYFYPGSIGRADMTFLTYLNDAIFLPFNYELEQPLGLIEMLIEHDFKQPAILNYQLMDALLANEGKYKKFSDNIIVRLNDKNKRGIDFIKEYIWHGNNLQAFIKGLCAEWPSMMKYFLSAEDDITLKRILRLTMKYAEIADIGGQNGDYVLVNYMNSSFEEIADALYNIRESRVLEIFGILSIQFVKINPEKAELFNLSYAQNHYELNENNICQIISVKSSNDIQFDRLSKANYTAILNSGCAELVDYVELEQESYVKNVLLLLNEDQEDDEENYMKLLNNRSIGRDIKITLLKKEKTKISFLNSITDSLLHPYIVEENKVEAKWENLLTYNPSEIDELSVKFINTTDNALLLGEQFFDSVTMFEVDTLTNFEELVLTNNSISDECYQHILKAFVPGYDNFDVTVLSEPKVKGLVEHDLINLSAKNYTRLKDYFPPLHIDLLANNVHKYFEDTSIFDIDILDRYMLLQENVIDLEAQLKLISKINVTSLKGNKDLSNIVLQILVKAKRLDMDEDYLMTLIRNGEDLNDRLVLFDYHLHNLHLYNIREILNLLGGDFAKLNQGKRPVFDLTPLIGSIVEKLYHENYISSRRYDYEKNVVKVNARLK